MFDLNFLLFIFTVGRFTKQLQCSQESCWCLPRTCRF